MSLGQNDRIRGRQTNRGREPNPLTCSYEPRGPDVRIRGTALHMAEKYLELAHDAHTGNNPVAAENYLQHAEHYFRLIATAQLQAQKGDVRTWTMMTISVACRMALSHSPRIGNFRWISRRRRGPQVIDFP